MFKNIFNIIKWIIRIILLGILVLLVYNNSQSVELNMLGIYKPTLPLIMFILIALLLGLIIGLLINFKQNLKLKSEIKSLHSQLKTTLK